MGLLDAINSSANALMTQQQGVRVASHNINSAGLPGFHRQDLVLQSRGVRGGGVQLQEVRRVVDEHLATRRNRQAGLLSYSETRAQHLGTLETSLGGIDEAGLNAALDEFFGSLRSLTATPNDEVVRAQVLQEAQVLTAQIRGTAERLSLSQTELDAEVTSQVSYINGLLAEVAELNNTILAARASGGDAHHLQDTRDAALKELAELAGATYSRESDSTVSVYLGGGISVVQAANYTALAATTNATTGRTDVSVSEGSTGVINARFTSGTLGALLRVRDTDLTAQMSSLDNFAYDLATAFNTTHRSNYGLDGTNNRDFFTAPTAVSGAAGALTVSSVIAADTDTIGAATASALLPGDNTGAVALVALESSDVASSSTMTLGEAARRLVINAADAKSDADRDVGAQQALFDDLELLHESQSGVSVEEQMLMLSRYQRAFQAASRLVSVTDTMLETLMAM